MIQPTGGCEIVEQVSCHARTMHLIRRSHLTNTGVMISSQPSHALLTARSIVQAIDVKSEKGIGSRTLMLIMKAFKPFAKPFDGEGDEGFSCSMLLIFAIACAIRTYCISHERKIVIEMSPEASRLFHTEWTFAFDFAYVTAWDSDPARTMMRRRLLKGKTKLLRYGVLRVSSQVKTVARIVSNTCWR